MPVTGIAEVNAVLRALPAVDYARGLEAAEEIALRLTEYAQATHPWQNQTGLTQETTHASVVTATRALITIILSSGSPYAIFLEKARQGRWAWLWPAVVANEPMILATLQRHLGAR